MSAKLAPVSILTGWLVLAIYWIVAFALSQVIGDYFLVSKAERDAAEAGSALSDTLATIKTTATILEPLKFVGLTLIIVGISLLLIAILQTLRLRAEAVKQAFITRLGKGS